jgi:2-haloalkanoic acid dehalogenase type II
MDHIRTLTFDLDDTLWDNRPVLMAAERILYEWLLRHYPRIGEHYTLEALRELRIDLAGRRPELRHHMTALRKLSLAIAAAAAGYGDELVERAFTIFLEARHRVTPYDDVIPALQRLRDAGYCLGSLTNGNADVGRLGIGHLFHFSLSAETVGYPKPHPRIFELACRTAGVEPAELAHVGDEPATDLAGARAAGLTVIWMNRLKQPADPDVTPHAEVSDMAELLALLGAGHNRADRDNCDLR